jgi:hypothetical protein
MRAAEIDNKRRRAKGSKDPATRTLGVGGVTLPPMIKIVSNVEGATRPIAEVTVAREAGEGVEEISTKPSQLKLSSLFL